MCTPNFGHGYLGISGYEWLRDLETSYTIETTVDILETVALHRTLSIPSPSYGLSLARSGMSHRACCRGFLPLCGQRRESPWAECTKQLLV
jgi:hypothetical protein